ncbi:snoRNA-binding rRNA-processing protein [Ascosphaera acerosa]|nr:snoRNA-binding rRNA-processing protein [Ascosphaera acerosa]
MPPKSSSAADAAAERRPLAEEILTAGQVRSKQKAPKSHKRKSRHDDDEEGSGDPYIDARASRKILQIGQDLAEEDAAEARAAAGASAREDARSAAFEFDYSKFATRDEDDEEEEELERGGDDWADEEEEVEEVEIDPNDLDMFHKFIPREGGEDPIFGTADDDESRQGASTGGTNLADLILEKIAEFEAKQSGQQQQPHIVGGGAAEDAVQLPVKVIEVYAKVGYLLSRYKSGALPKPFKILPSLPQWRTLLDVTEPDKWTPNAIFAATRVFISTKPHIAQEFISSVLLDRVRDDIRESKKLNVHIYNALKKALYKPACFFKGFLFPLVGSGTCTLREAAIVSSVIARVSIPVLHSAAALLRMCDIAAEQTTASLSSEGTGAVNMFIRVFLEKKYALPYKVIDALVFHFLRFRALDEDDDTDMAGASGSGKKNLKLPVLWHQSLLVFAQRYRNDITEDQREALLDLINARGHKDIGPEVRRELLAGRGRGVVQPENVPGFNGNLGMLPPGVAAANAGAAAAGGAMNGGDDTMDMML